MSEFLESSILTNLNSLPIQVPTKGEGASSILFTSEDFIVVNSNGDMAVDSYYIMGPRIPTNAKIKKVEAYSSGNNGNNSASLDVNVIFSDAPSGGLAGGVSVSDGTRPDLAGQIPTAANDGTVTSLALYSNPNILFGSFVISATNWTDLTFATGVSLYVFEDCLLPLWKKFGFTQDPGGFFNFALVVNSGSGGISGSATTGLRVTYAV